jgi:4-amino-4-deoxy-L-arabinose transferase-like glycosyltransferase
VTTASPVRDTDDRPDGPSPDQEGDAEPIIVDGGPAEGAADPSLPRGSGRRRAYILAVVAIVAVGGLLRAAGLGSGLPYTSYIDEGYVLRPALTMAADQTWAPGWYNYPSLLIDLTAAGVLGADVVSDGVGGEVSIAADAANYNAVAPAALIVAGRIWVWLAATATVLVTILLASRLAGRRVGLVAGAVVAFVPALVTRSAVVIVDTPATFFVMAAMLAASSLARTRRPFLVAAAGGALSGLALTSKYPSAAVIAVVWTVIAMSSSFGLRRKLALGAASAAAMAASAVITMPALALRTSAVISGLEHQAEIYAGKATETGYIQAGLTRVELGWWFAVPALIGLVLLLRHRRSRPVTVGWLVFLVAIAVVVSRSNYQPFRNVLPLVPFLAIAVATTVVALVRFVRRALLPARWRGASGAISVGLTSVLTIGLVAAMFVAGVRPYLDNAANVTDSRTEVVDWLVTQTTPDQRVLIASELSIVRSDVGRIPAQVTVVPTVGSVDIDWSDYDYVVVGAFQEFTVPPELASSWVVARFGKARV